MHTTMVCRLWCAGKLVLAWKEPWYVVFVDFCGLNSPSLTDFRLSVSNNHSCKTPGYLTVGPGFPIQVRVQHTAVCILHFGMLYIRGYVFKIQISFIYFSLWHGSWSSGSSRDPLNLGIWTSIDQWMWQFGTRRATPNKATHRSGTHSLFPFSLTLLCLLLIFCCSARLWNYYWLNGYPIQKRKQAEINLYNSYFFHMSILVFKAIEVKL